MEEIVKQLVDVHQKLAVALEQTDSLPEFDEDDLARGRVAYPLSDADVARLESIAGFTFSPLLRQLFQTQGAMPVFEVDVFGMSHWVGSWALESNQETAKARADYDWDLPKLVRIDTHEDFFAVTEDGELVNVCGNEGNIERRHGSLEGWLGRYVASAALMAEDPEAYREGDNQEDPEAEYE